MRHSVLSALRLYATPRLITVLLVGISSGLPLTLILSTLSFWLSTVGVSKTMIGLFAFLGTPYTLKFLWSPLIDRAPLPFLTRWLGRRRGWLIVIQAGLITSIVFTGHSDPANTLYLTALGALLIATFSASQDIVLDAYRIEILEKDEQSAGAAMYVAGYRVGNLIAGAGTIALAGFWGYQAAYTLTAFIALLGLVAALFYGEPHVGETEESRAIQKEAEAHLLKKGTTGLLAEFTAWIYVSVIGPFREFMARRGWFLILLFIVIYKLGDALAATMTAPLIEELGFSELEYASANKIVGFVALIVGTYLGGAVQYMLGMFRALLVTAVFMMITNLMFALLAVVGHDIPMLVATIAFENFASGLGLAVFVAYLSGLCNVAFTATQYALLSSLSAVGRQWMSASGGVVADAIGWVPFFVVTTFAAVPGILLLIWLWRAGFQADAPVKKP